MENANWVDYAQVGLMVIGLCLWLVPQKSEGGPPLKLPLWNPSWWDVILYLIAGTSALVIGFPGSFIFPCIIFFILQEVDPTKYEAPFSSQSLSYSQITKKAVRYFVLHWPLLLMVFWIWSLLAPHAETQQNVKDLREGDWIMRSQIAFFAVIVAPLTEELFFRGILYRTLKSLTDAGPAILLTSLAFAGAHSNLLSFGPLFALSVFLILAYEKSGHLAVPIVYHACFNLLMIIFIIFGGV
jgi:membrane protease YdiL (CAAX protease family)